MYSWEFWFATEVSGSGDVASGVAVAGQASETFAAAGAVATPSVAIAGSGAQTFAGAGNVTVGVAISGEASVRVISASSGVGAGSYQRADNAAILAALNAQQIGRRKDAEAVYLAAVAHNAEVMRERRAAAEARRQREEEWLLGLITTEQMLAA